MNRRRLLLVLVATLIALPACRTTGPGWQYPDARRQELVEDYHGTPVAAPYRWLEEDDSDETRAWTEAENRLTFGFLDSTGLREPLRKRFTVLWNYPKFSAPSKHGGRYFFAQNDGLQNQSVIYVQEGLEGVPRVLLDPNVLSEDGTTALSGGALSDDGAFFAYGLSVHGSDRQEFHVRDVATGEDLDDHIRWCKFSGIAWAPDNSGFYYNRFPRPGTVAPEDENNYNRVYWHSLGTTQEEDRLVFERPDEKELGFDPTISEDGKVLVLTVYHGTDPRNGLYVMPLRADGQPAQEAFTHLVEPGRAMFSFVGHVDGHLFVHTDRNAPRGRLVAIDLAAPAEKYWRELISEDDRAVIESVSLAGGKLVVVAMVDAHNTLSRCDLDGRECVEIKLPGMGSIAGLSARNDDPEFFYTYTSFLAPPIIYRYDVATGNEELFRAAKISFDAQQYETRQLFFTSKDGTRVPLFVTHRKGLKANGKTPVLLYGYGGFNINLTPHFSVHRLPFLEAGGIYALVTLRGGAEYGEEWHQAGMLERKQNVFDDFIGAAQYLVAEGYTQPRLIATLGGSNGGLLVCATMLQRPDLFGAVVAAVPVTDMLRYHKFTVGRYWVPEYGNAEEKPEHFQFLYAYSPLHNVAKGGDYPPILVTTADTDDRVVPGHSRKFVATLQALAGRKSPALIRIETRAGHGAGKPTTKRIEEAADMYAFIFHFLGMSVPKTSVP